MDLDEGALKLIDPENLTVLNTQPIHTIRVWGVGRDNGRYNCCNYSLRGRGRNGFHSVLTIITPLVSYCMYLLSF